MKKTSWREPVLYGSTSLKSRLFLEPKPTPEGQKIVDSFDYASLEMGLLALLLEMQNTE